MESHQSFERKSFHLSWIFPARHHCCGRSLRTSGGVSLLGSRCPLSWLPAAPSWYPYSMTRFLTSNVGYSLRALLSFGISASLGINCLLDCYHLQLDSASNPFLFLNYSNLNFLWLNDGISLSQSFYQAVVLTLRPLLTWDLLCHREQSLWLIHRITGKDFFLTLSGTLWNVGTSCRIVRLNDYNVLTDRLFWWELESSKDFVVNLIGSGIEIGLLWWSVKRLLFGY